MRNAFNNNQNDLTKDALLEIINPTFADGIGRALFIRNIGRIEESFSNRLYTLEQNIHLDDTAEFLDFYEDTLQIYSSLKSALRNKRNDHEMKSILKHKLNDFESFKRRCEAVAVFKSKGRLVSKWKELIRNNPIVTRSAEYIEAVRNNRQEEFLERVAIETFKTYQYQYELHRASNNNLVYAFKAITIGAVLSAAHATIPIAGFFKNYWAWLTSKDMLAISSFVLGIPTIVGFAFLVACAALVPVAALLAGVASWFLCDIAKYEYDTRISYKIALGDSQITNAIAAVSAQPVIERREMTDDELLHAIQQESVSNASFVRKISNRMMLRGAVNARVQLLNDALSRGGVREYEAISQRILPIINAVRSINKVNNPDFREDHPIYSWAIQKEFVQEVFAKELNQYDFVSYKHSELEEFDTNPRVRQYWKDLVLEDGSPLRNSQAFRFANESQLDQLTTSVAFNAYSAYCVNRRYCSDREMSIALLSGSVGTFVGLEVLLHTLTGFAFTPLLIAAPLIVIVPISVGFGYVCMETITRSRSREDRKIALAPENLNSVIERIGRDLGITGESQQQARCA